MLDSSASIGVSPRGAALRGESRAPDLLDLVRPNVVGTKGPVRHHGGAVAWACSWALFLGVFLGVAWALVCALVRARAVGVLADGDANCRLRVTKLVVSG